MNRERDLICLLAEGAGGEHLGDEVDVAAGDVDPGGVELHDVAVLERLEEVDLAVEPLQVLGALQEVVQLHLVPRHLHPLVLVERPVHGLGRALAKNVVVLHSKKNGSAIW
jgi:hypothetical protein